MSRPDEWCPNPLGDYAEEREVLSMRISGQEWI